MARIGILVVGAGRIGRRHVGLVERSGRCELLGVVDPVPAAAEPATALGVPWYGSLSAALDRCGGPGVGVIVATPSRLHGAHVAECLAAGLPVLVEKPLADTVDEGAAMATASARTGVPLLAGPGDPLERQLDHFCDVVAGAVAPLVSGADALRTLRVTLATAEAARTGQVVVPTG